jgi:phosphoribosylformylglycinamidine synthase PurS subunit
MDTSLRWYDRIERRKMKAKIHITLKNGVLDPQGRAIAGALHNMGYGEVEEVRQGKYIEVDLKTTDSEKAKTTLDKICSSLLANTVVENYKYELVE